MVPSQHETCHAHPTPFIVVAKMSMLLARLTGGWRSCTVRLGRVTTMRGISLTTDKAEIDMEAEGEPHEVEDIVRKAIPGDDKQSRLHPRKPEQDEDVKVLLLY